MRYNQPFGVVDPDAPFINGDPSQARKGSIIPAEAVEFPQREIVGLTEYAGFQPTNDDLEQLTRGVRQGVNYILATYNPAAPNDLKVALDPTLDTYRPGLVLRVKIPIANTGSATLEVDGLGAKQIRRANGAVLSAGDLVAGMVAALVYDGAAFQMINFMGLGGTGDINNYVTNIPYCDDVGTANHMLAPFSPAITSLTPGLFILVKVAQPNSSPVVDIKVNALATVKVVRPDLKGLAPHDLITGTIAVMCFDGTQFQLFSYASMPRILLAPIAYYVNQATGSDTLNDGLTAATPFATINKAILEMSLWTNTGFEFRIYVANGQYGRTTSMPINGSGSVRIIGNENNPELCQIYDKFADGSSNSTEAMTIHDRYTVSGFKLMSDGGWGLIFQTGGNAGIFNMDFGPCALAHIAVNNVSTLGLASFVVPNSFIRISGSAYYHMVVSANSVILNSTDVQPPIDLIINNSVVINYFALVTGSALLNLYYRQIVNAGFVTGTKFNIQGNSAIQVHGRGINYYPGSYAGLIEPGSTYS
jgi:hypothetical protein